LTFNTNILLGNTKYTYIWYTVLRSGK